jgi:hypothetical protein
VSGVNLDRRPQARDLRGATLAIVEKGDLVSDFELPDESGSSRRLSEFLAEGPVVVYI